MHALLDNFHGNCFCSWQTGIGRTLEDEEAREPLAANPGKVTLAIWAAMFCNNFFYFYFFIERTAILYLLSS